MTIFKLAIFLVILLAQISFCAISNADTKTTADVTEDSAGAETSCSTRCTNYNFDPRSDIASDGGDDDDVVYWDHHGALYPNYNYGIDTEWKITNDVKSFLTEEEMLQGFTMDASVGLRDRNYIGGDPFTMKIEVTDGTTTYSDLASFTTPAGQDYQTVTSQLIVPQNTLTYSLATFGLILDGASLSGGYGGPQTNMINLTATYDIINDQVQNTILDLVANAVDDIVVSSQDIMQNNDMSPTTPSPLGQVVNASVGTNMQITIATPAGQQMLNVPVAVSPGAITISVPSTAGTIQPITINTGMSAPSAPPVAAPQVSSAVAAVAKIQAAPSAPAAPVASAAPVAKSTPAAPVSKSTPKSESKKPQKPAAKQESKQDVKQTNASKAKAVQAIVSRVLEVVSMAGGDVDGTKLALMGALGAPGFKDYQQAGIPDMPMYVSEIPYEKTLIDPLSSIYTLGSDQMMNKMIDSQYNFEK
tara:strand:- start:84 stop:1505 length:1422 start_codon:yes stop_codon:yes gene_type:complete